MIHLITQLPIFQYEVFYFSGKQALSHFHARFLHLLNGELSVKTEDAQYEMKGGDILFLPEETVYHIYAWRSSLLLYVCIHPYFLLNTFGYPRHRFLPFYSDDHPEQKETLNGKLAQLAAQLLIQETEAQPSGTYARAYELMDYLLRHCKAQVDPFGIPEKAAEKLRKLEEFLGSNYTAPLSLGDAACALGYTPQYLSSFLKKHLHMTFQEYLNSFRLDAARILLRYSQEPLSKIGFQCGFPNQNSFLRCFEKACGQTAEQFREESLTAVSRQDSLSGIPITNHSLILDYIFNYMDYTTPPVAPHTETILEEAQILPHSSSPRKPIWNFLINLGSVRYFEKPTFRNQLIRMQEELHFQYGRCTEVFTLVKIYTINQVKTYDFSQLFRLIDFLKSIRLLPFFDIDNKPFRLYKAPEVTVDYDAFLSAKNYDAFLLEVLPEFIKACIIRYGFDEFSTWKFELWRRYNVNMSSLEPPDVFCRRFQQVAEIFKTLVPNASLGGPGFNGFRDTQRFRELLLAFQDARYQPDFISAYYLPYAARAGDDIQNPSGYKASAHARTMVDKLKEWKTMIEEINMGHLPFYITEYSTHISLENYINDSTYAAAYIFHQGIQNQANADALGYWLASDFPLEYGNPNSPLFGGNGLVTKHGIQKPAYYAHDFLNRLGERILYQGEHSIVTHDRNGSLQILVYHYGILKQSFADAPMNQELLQYPYSAFEDAKPLEFRLTFSELPKGTYRFKEFSIDLDHGNVLRIWGQLNYSTNVNEDEIQYMASQSVPSMRIHTEELKGAYTLHTVLNHNEARLILIEPIFKGA